jgi:hypothetical protein
VDVLDGDLQTEEQEFENVSIKKSQLSTT